jgi:glycosyltransferase involved in cell wall biosynthesis
MNYYIVIPAHNEAALISLTLESLVRTNATLPKKIVVNDNSTDNTADIVLAFIKSIRLSPCRKKAQYARK